MPISIPCIQCGEHFSVVPARAKTAKFCSYSCRGRWRQKNWLGPNHPNWQGGKRTKFCSGCGKSFSIRKTQPITTFKTQKFCSKECADRYGFRYHGKENHKWRGGVDRRERRASIAGGNYKRWTKEVLAKSGFACVRCNAEGRDVELHAHHIKPVEFYPQLINDVSNGIALCAECHWEVHSTGDSEYLVLPTDEQLNDPLQKPAQPSTKHRPTGKRKGRTSRRWFGNCHWCGLEISKRLSDTAGKSHVFCGRSCAVKHLRTFRHTGMKSNTVPPSTAVPPPPNERTNPTTKVPR